MRLTPDQAQRYDRNIRVPGLGVEGQKKLLCSSALIVGVGGLGSPAALYLAAAGIGRLGIADSDVVSLSNLQRQILHFTPDIGKPKTLSARDKLTALNPDCEIVMHTYAVTEDNAAQVIAGYDIVIDATDNFPSRFILNKACLALGKAFIHAAVLSMSGRAMTVLPYSSACLRCVFRQLPAPHVPSTSELGVFGAIPGLIASIQVTEAVKYLLGQGELLTNRMLIYDGMSMCFELVEVLRDPDCPDCGQPSMIKRGCNYD